MLHSSQRVTHLAFGVRRSSEYDTGFAFPSDGAGHPVCTAAPPLRIVDSFFTPDPCISGPECGSIHVVVESANSGDPLPNGTIVTCDLTIDRQSEIGVAIVCQFVEASAGSGPVTLGCDYGRLEVVFPTVTPTPTPAPSATSTPDPPPGGGDSGGGCQLGDGGASFWPVVVVFPSWWWRKRCRRWLRHGRF